MEDRLDLIYNQLRAIRKRKGITQQDLTELTDLSIPYISQIENNKPSISLGTFLKITQALDIFLGDFFQPYSNGIDKDTRKLILVINKNKCSKELVKEVLKIIEISNQ